MDGSQASRMDTFYDILARAAAPDFERQSRSLLVEAEATLAEIEAQIQTLLYARDRQRARVAALKYAVAPVRMLPADVLTEIFLNVVKRSTSKQVKRALRVAGVCAYWRQLALSTPRLWDMPMILDASSVSPAYAAVTNDILKRSSPHPISLTLAVRDETKPTSSALLKTVIAFVHRWRSINVNFDILPFLESVPAQTLHHLTSATFDLLSGTEGPPSALFVDAPRLSGLCLSIRDLSTLRFPWSQLTELNLTIGPSSPLLLGTIGQCTSLCDLRLDAAAWKAGDLPPLSDMVILAHLKTCVLRITQQEDGDLCTFTPFFAQFAFPTLQSLEIHMEMDDEEAFLDDAFAPFLGRCPSLELLWIMSCDMDSDALGNILLHVPSLKTLELFYCQYCVDTAFFERLTYRQTGFTPTAAPCLQKVILYGVGDNYDEECIREMILSRWWSDETLQALPAPPRVARWENISVFDYASQDCSEDFEAAMNELRAQGLGVDIKVKKR
ncbi:hypothetical protein C8F01DRAFT_319381 [Mycena amicta]|nr:hypothetical protein C8F01DRAFT_319381 [Mycena amicta]